MLSNLISVAGTTGATGANEALTTAFTQAASDMSSQISTIAPIAIGVVTAGLVVTFGVKFFKRITGKA